MIMAPYKIKKECYLLWSCTVDSRRMLLLVVEQAFLPLGEVWSMCDADTQCTGEKSKETKEQGHFLMFFHSFVALPQNVNFISHQG